eukprot:COSAG06_NODE_5401_length_3504_cov_39.334508_1_plen_188_part_10
MLSERSRGRQGLPLLRTVAAPRPAAAWRGGRRKGWAEEPSVSATGGVICGNAAREQHTLTHALGPPDLLAGGGTARELPCWYGSRLLQGAAGGCSSSRRSRSSYTTSSFSASQHRFISAHIVTVDLGTARCTAAPYRCARGTVSLRVETQPGCYPVGMAVAWFHAVVSQSACRSRHQLSELFPINPLA